MSARGTRSLRNHDLSRKSSSGTPIWSLKWSCAPCAMSSIFIRRASSTRSRSTVTSPLGTKPPANRNVRAWSVCLRHLNALVSPHPWDLEAVRPIFDPDLSKYRLVDAHDAAAGLDARPVLVEMRPLEFEILVKQLFEAMGMKSWVTQASRDDGVDAVAMNEDPIMGGTCVIQAKRYRAVVPVEAVRALAGVMDDKRASRGVLVTTSWFGKATEDFAARHGRIQLITGPRVEAPARRASRPRRRARPAQGPLTRRGRGTGFPGAATASREVKKRPLWLECGRRIGCGRAQRSGRRRRGVRRVCRVR